MTPPRLLPFLDNVPEGTVFETFADFFYDGAQASNMGELRDLCGCGNESMFVVRLLRFDGNEFSPLEYPDAGVSFAIDSETVGMSFRALVNPKEPRYVTFPATVELLAEARDALQPSNSNPPL